MKTHVLCFPDPAGGRTDVGYVGVARLPHYGDSPISVRANEAEVELGKCLGILGLRNACYRKTDKSNQKNLSHESKFRWEDTVARLKEKAKIH